MGALGVVHPNGDLELGLTIRTLAIADGFIHLWVGGGIVWDSDPLAEVEESLVKARPLAPCSAQRSAETIRPTAAAASRPAGDAHHSACPSTNVCHAQSAFSRSRSTPQ